MIKDDPVINSLIHENIIEKLVKEKNLTIDEAVSILSSMSFKEYYTLLEAPIVPPSGQSISSVKQQKPQAATSAPSKNVKAIWPGSGAPLELGMAVGISDPKGAPANAVVTQVDKSANGVKVRTVQGKEEWYNTNSLQPGMALSQSSTSPTQTTEDADISRLRKLAGIVENCSSGATGAANISVGMVNVGDNVVRRQTASEKKYTKEYAQESSTTTIVGDTKPNQASGQLSSELVARGKKTASRKNNGFKR